MIADSNITESKLQLSFSEHEKHPNIQILSPTIIKSTSTSGYKFAILNPALNSKGIKKRVFAFKIKEVSSNNWIALGICHAKIIIEKAFNFTFSTLGHGAYMISSNGGTWSHHDSAANNLVKSFNFI